jgi:glycosyltransferase involved in cell wall biosynthesis
MSELPLISIIIPVYNTEKYLEECLLSVQTQDYKNIEVIIIDDGSRDNSAAICKAFTEKDSRFRYFYQENAGVSTARNNALKMANGELIAFVDSDDCVKPDMYTSMYKIMSETSSDVVITSAEAIVNGVWQGEAASVEVELLDTKSAIIEMHKSEKFAGAVWNKLIRRETLDGVEFSSDIAIGEDFLFCWQVLLRSRQVAFSNNRKYGYRQNPTSAMNSTFKESYLSTIEAAKRTRELMKTHFPDSLVYADLTVTSAYIDVIDKLQGAKRLTRELSRKYRLELREYATPEVYKIIWWYKRFSLRLFLMGDTAYKCYYSVLRMTRACRRFAVKLFKH